VLSFCFGFQQHDGVIAAEVRLTLRSFSPKSTQIKHKKKDSAKKTGTKWFRQSLLTSKVAQRFPESRVKACIKRHGVVPSLEPHGNAASVAYLVGLIETIEARPRSIESASRLCSSGSTIPFATMQSTYPSSYLEHDNVEVVKAASSSSSSSSSFSPTIKQCFSSIQSRKLWGPSCPNTCRLCPSMDLAVLGIQMPPTSSSTTNETATATTTTTTTASMATATPPTTNDDDNVAAVASSLWIHRTVSWQRLATLSFEKHEGISRVTWSPDGRHLALASLDRVLLYQVESLSNQTGSYGSSSSGVETTPNHTLNVLSKDVGVEKGHHHHHHHASRILGLTWAHVGRPHPTAWKLSDDQVEDQISWRYECIYMILLCVSMSFCPSLSLKARVCVGHK
jgi:hypothetical protein